MVDTRRRWLSAAVLVLAVGACTASSTSADDRADGRSDGRSDGPATSIVGAEAPAPSSGPTAGNPALGTLTRITGPVTDAELTGALDAPVALPLALTVPSGGGGNGAIITGIDAAGGDTVVWDGGRPVTLSGDGTIGIQPGPFRVAAGGLYADLSGAAHPLSPGSYSIVGPVAVGDGTGLAAPSTQTAFTAGDRAVLSGTGRVEGRLPTGTWLLLGPGAVSLSGDLQVETRDSVARARSASMADGSFEVTFTIAGDGTVTVEALFDGEVVT